MSNKDYADKINYRKASSLMWFFTFLVGIFIATTVQAASYAKIFKKVDPSVVVIYSQEKVVVKGAAGFNQKSTRSLGSGIVITKEGLIMTAAHVVQVSDKVVVEFRDGKKYPAHVVSSSTIADVALIKLDQLPDQLKIAKLGDSDKIQIGDEVFVIGAPYGIEHTLTVGYLSGRRMEGMLGPQLGAIEFLQTDAAINKGNSGGPLFNKKGQVMGIVSHIASGSGGSDGLGFATSINVARRLLLEEKAVWTGLELIPIDGDLAAALNVPGGGMLVQRVAKNSLGYFLRLRAGSIPVMVGNQEILIGGDVILSLNGIELNEIEDALKVRDELVKLPYGSRIDVEILREGRVKSLFTSKQKRN